MDAVVIGAGPAGLAVGAALTRAGISPVILERANAAGSTWRHHYDRLHLHTDAGRSHLPGLRFPKSAGKYPSRDDVVNYLEEYARHHRLDIRFRADVTNIGRRNGGAWRTTFGPDGEFIESSNVVVATGYSSIPVLPDWPGLSGFAGSFLHSAAYRNGAPFAGRRVLVAGFGNSGGEIAIDLQEHGAEVTMTVRSPVNVTRREILGLPMLAITIPLSRLPPTIADAMVKPVARLLFRDLSSLGLRRSDKGPFRQMAEDRRIPLIDIGTIDLIRAGAIEVRPGVRDVHPESVSFEDGSRKPFDAIVAATGYRPSCASFVPSEYLDGDGVPTANGGEPAAPGLYFCGFRVSSTGMLRAVAAESREIAGSIALRRTREPHSPTVGQRPLGTIDVLG